MRIIHQLLDCDTSRTVTSLPASTDTSLSPVAACVETATAEKGGVGSLESIPYVWDPEVGAAREDAREDAHVFLGADPADPADSLLVLSEVNHDRFFAFAVPVEAPSAFVFRVNNCNETFFFLPF